MDVAADRSSNNFNLQLSKVPGVKPHVNFDNELDSLEDIISEDVVQADINMINELAQAKLQMSNPAKSFLCMVIGEMWKL